MSVVSIDAKVEKNHSPLVFAARTTLESVAHDRRIVFCEPDTLASGKDRPAGDSVIALEQTHQPAITRQGSVIAHLQYDDPASEAACAALIALGAGTTMPVAADPATLALLTMAQRIAQSEIPVLIEGPTGTGKEVISRYIHAQSRRSQGPFIAVNCAAMPETMLEALLFGHQKGAFTGANVATQGFFRAADGGTLLLDEIAEMPIALQAKLLRALQEGEVVPLGATRPVKIDVRVIACANRDLPREVEEGRFRADLYYRLNVFPLQLPALRERPADIAALGFAMVLRHGGDGPTGALPWLTSAAITKLRAHSWPGNVRELENVIRRALLLAGQSATIEPVHIQFDRSVRPVNTPPALAGHAIDAPTPAVPDTPVFEIPRGKGGRLSNIRQVSEAKAIIRTLEDCGGSRIAAARQLGISERTLRYRLASFRDAGIAVAGAGR